MICFCGHKASVHSREDSEYKDTRCLCVDCSCAEYSPNYPWACQHAIVAMDRLFKHIGAGFWQAIDTGDDDVLNECRVCGGDDKIGHRSYCLLQEAITLAKKAAEELKL